jgi:hypothetical protein
VNSSIHKNNLAFLCKTFIEDPDQFEYSKRLEYLFFKPANLFSVKFDIEGSRLYQYYLKHKTEFDDKFNKAYQVMVDFFAKSSTLSAEEEQKALEKMRKDNEDKKKELNDLLAEYYVIINLFSILILIKIQ